MRRIDKNTFGPWAVVTGASSGIGKEFARQLAASGLNLVLVARRLSALEALGSELAKTFSIRYRAVELDLSSDDFLERMEQATQDLDIGLVISNAGAMMAGDFLTIDQQSWQPFLRLNVKAHLDLAHHFGQHLAQRKRGGLLLVSSTAGLQGIPFSAEYAAAKAYVLTLGEALHIEFQKKGVHVTVLLPGATDTPMLAASGFSPDKLPVKPMSTTQCVAEGLAALSANRATHIAGSLNRVMAALMPRQLAIRMYGGLTQQLMVKTQHIGNNRSNELRSTRRI
jgi:short-subunit dehydrogenase